MSRSLPAVQLKQALRETRHAWRQRSAADRKLPDLLIIGGQKCGTTSLHYYLGQHPDLIVGTRKEVHYFDGGTTPGVDTFARGSEWYRAHFPRIASLNAGQSTFEATPLYLFHPLAAERIHALLPEARLVVLLRDPTERAISHYFHEVRRGRESLSIEEAIEQEEQRLAPAWASEAYSSLPFVHYSYVARGRYAEQLERYLSWFDPARMLILESGALFADPHGVAREVCRFAGVDPDFELHDPESRNTRPASMQAPAEVRQQLQEIFRPHNEKLYDVLRTRFGWTRVPDWP